jgi:hypothetical protein
MTEPTRYATLAARLLRERPLTKESRLSRDVGISVVAHGIAMRRKRRGARLAVAGVGLAAVAALAVFFAVAPRNPPANACHGANCAAGGERRRALDAGQSIVAPEGAPTSVVLASGTQIALDAKSVLECRDATATQRFALLRGGAHLHVAKLRANERFLVDTPEAEVEVRGTVFDVKLDPATGDCAERSRVVVHEGRVEVRAGADAVTLVGGEQWTSPCARPVVPAPGQAVTEGSAPPRTRPIERLASDATRRAAPKPVAPSTPQHAEAPAASTAAESNAAASWLGEQNDLYAVAEAARRAGRSGDALAAYGRLLGRFPHGQLAESAFVERVRLLSQSDAASARAEAERYLTRYPAGFARSEMQALAHSP